MANTLVNLFEGKEITSIRVNSEVWFKGIDVTRMMEYKNINNPLADVLEDHHKTTLEHLVKMLDDPKITLTHNEKNTIYISEFGLHALLSKSRKLVSKDVLDFFAQNFNIEIPRFIRYECKESETCLYLKQAFQHLDIKYQYPVGTYRVDMLFPQFELVVECDELGHKDRNDEYEKTRTDFIESQGYKIIRYNPDSKDFSVFSVINKITLFINNEVEKQYEKLQNKCNYLQDQNDILQESLENLQYNNDLLQSEIRHAEFEENYNKENNIDTNNHSICDVNTKLQRLEGKIDWILGNSIKQTESKVNLPYEDRKLTPEELRKETEEEQKETEEETQEIKEPTVRTTEEETQENEVIEEEPTLTTNETSITHIQDFFDRYTELGEDTSSNDKYRIKMDDLYTYYTEKCVDPISLFDFNTYIKDTFQLQAKPCSWYAKTHKTWFGIKIQDSLKRESKIDVYLRNFIETSCKVGEGKFINTKIFNDTFKEYCQEYETDVASLKYIGITPSATKKSLIKLGFGYQEWLIGGKLHGYTNITLNSLLSTKESVELFIEECCDVSYGYRVKTTTMWENYQRFIKEKNLYVSVVRKQFYDCLIDDLHFVRRGISKADIGFIGIKLKSSRLIET
jgi:very-short-patch-repair endonuclease